MAQPHDVPDDDTTGLNVVQLGRVVVCPACGLKGVCGERDGGTQSGHIFLLSRAWTVPEGHWNVATHRTIFYSFLRIAAECTICKTKQMFLPVTPERRGPEEKGDV